MDHQWFWDQQELANCLVKALFEHLLQSFLQLWLLLEGHTKALGSRGLSGRLDGGPGRRRGTTVQGVNWWGGAKNHAQNLM